MDPVCLRGDLARTERDLHPRPVLCPPTCGRRCESIDAGLEQTEGSDKDDQRPAERRAGR